jgi:hypothetical protein
VASIDPRSLDTMAEAQQSQAVAEFGHPQRTLIHTIDAEAIADVTAEMMTQDLLEMIEIGGLDTRKVIIN